MADWPPNGKAAQEVLTVGEERFPGCATVGLLIGSRRGASDRGGTGVSLVGVFALAVQCSWGGAGAGTRKGVVALEPFRVVHTSGGRRKILSR